MRFQGDNFFFYHVPENFFFFFSCSPFDTLSNVVSRAPGELFEPSRAPSPGPKVVISLRTSFKNRLLYRSSSRTLFQALREAPRAIFGPPWEPSWSPELPSGSPPARPREPLPV